ncbi:MAG: YraN family protein [Candidatus Competibacteraceae bacterium]|jgi:putative endonuclease|nr:YraN family protein [Candidatus Competibacteraceae bacterium]
MKRRSTRSKINGPTTGQRGDAAEALACRYLEARGLVLVTRNFRCRLGELDLVMRDGSQMVFVEVRSRSNRNYGGPIETITPTKQKRLLRAAAYYLQKTACSAPCRFDAVGITSDNGIDTVEWINNAFQADW